MKKKVQIIPNLSAKVAKELKFIKRVAGNDSRLSEETLEKLAEWIQCYHSAFTDEDITHMWKGLFLCMWMSDKPLAQEKLAESLASLLHCFDKKEDSIRFYSAFLQIMAKEWFTIDQRRIDKFRMVRKIVRIEKQKLIFLFLQLFNIIAAVSTGNQTSFRYFG